MQQIKTRIKNKTNSIQTWETTLSNYVLLNGELAIVSCETENKLKFGDGSTPFYQLPYYGIDLSNIKSTYVDGVECDLSVQHISLSDYANLLNTDQAISNVLYIVSSDTFDACNERITNVATPVDDMDAVNLSTLWLAIATEAEDKGYVLSSRSIAGLKLSSDITTQQLKDAIDLSTYEQTKSQLSADGYATQSSIPSYSDISTNIHLSNYALASSVSSTTELNAKFNTLSTYSQTKQQLSSDGYVVESQLSAKNASYVSQSFDGQLQQTDLSVVKVRDEDLSSYAAALHDDALDQNALYVMQLSTFTGFGRKLQDIAPGTLSSDAATYGQLAALSAAVFNILESIQQQLQQMNNT